MTPFLLSGVLDPTWLTAVLFIALRISALFVATPILAEANVPVSVRILLIVAIAVALAGTLPRVGVGVGIGIGVGDGIGNGAGIAVNAPLTLAALFTGALGELTLGATMALGVLLAFSGFSVAGRLLDVQTGFAIGQVFDPVSRQQLTVLTAAFNRLAVIVFFCLEGHGVLLRGLALSLEHFPPGQSWPLGLAFLPVVKQAATAFSYGFSLAAPLVLCLLLVDFGLGALARNLPQMNIFMLGLPIKVICGLFGLAIWLPAAGAAMTRLYESIFLMWQGWLQHG